MEKKKWTKLCPNCGNEQTYSTKGNLKLATQSNKVCMDCRNIHLSEIKKGHWSGDKNPMYGVSKCGEENPFYGKKHSEETKLAHSVYMRGRYVGEENSFYGKKHSEETKKVISNKKSGTTLSVDARKNIRLGVIKYREKNGLDGFIPNYNPNSISILEQKASELGITDLQHAENGGEFFISELGYWVDGYSKEKNIVLEYDEPHHFNVDGTLKEKDIKRQEEIQKYLNCKFIRISE